MFANERNAKTLEFAAKYYVGGATNGTLIEGPTFTVRTARPGFLRIEELRNRREKSKRPEFPLKYHALLPFNVFVSDGENQYELATASNTYIKSKAAPSLSGVVGLKGLPSIIAPDVIFANDPLRGFTSLGFDQFNGRRLAVYTRTVSRNFSYNGQSVHMPEEQRLYVSTQNDTPTLWRVYTLNHSRQLSLVSETIFSHWRVNAPVSEIMFNTRPPLGARPVPVKIAE